MLKCDGLELVVNKFDKNYKFLMLVRINGWEELFWLTISAKQSVQWLGWALAHMVNVGGGVNLRFVGNLSCLN